jgi:hypothetical protein
MTAWWLVAAATAAAALVFGDLTHFTWWAVVQFYGYSLVTVAGFGERYALTFVAQALAIIASICAMSLLGCDLLTDAADEYGYLYLPLNFIVHYVPVLVVLAYPPAKPAVNPRHQLALALAMFAVYVTHPPGIDVYGCAIDHDVSIAAVLAATVTFSLLLLAPCRAPTRRLTPSSPRPPAKTVVLEFM